MQPERLHWGESPCTRRYRRLFAGAYTSASARLIALVTLGAPWPAGWEDDGLHADEAAGCRRATLLQRTRGAERHSQITGRAGARIVLAEPEQGAIVHHPDRRAEETDGDATKRVIAPGQWRQQRRGRCADSGGLLEESGRERRTRAALPNLEGRALAAVRSAGPVSGYAGHRLPPRPPSRETKQRHCGTWALFVQS